MQESRELLLAALLCDFQRFYGEPAEDFVRDHSGLFSRYLDVEKLGLILAASPQYDSLVAIVREARRVSLMESVRTDKLDSKKNLTTVFSRVRIKRDENIQKMRYHYRPLDPEACFPVAGPEIDKDDISVLRDGFKKEMDGLSRQGPESFDVFLTLFDNLLECYLWCVTAADHEGEDISLYAHLKNTAVIAMCKWICLQEGVGTGEEYCMVMADFSGIQDYIFSVNNMNESGVTKRLRARSFMVDTMVTVFSHVLIHKFQVPMLHILLLTGGKFYLLLPNTSSAPEILTAARREFSQYLFERFKGQIAVNLVWVAGGCDLLEDYSQTIVALTEKLSVEKAGNFRDVLLDEEGWKEDAFELYPDLSDKIVCTSCGAELADKRELHCKNCQFQEKIGGMLPKTQYIVYSNTGVDDCEYPIYHSYGISLCSKIPEKRGYLIEKLNASSSCPAEAQLPIKCRYMANHIPLDHTGLPKSFSEISACAKGDKKLGVLKADVDTLGFIFAAGLRDVDVPERHYGTISRTATMSRLLVIFFSGYIDMLLDTDKKYRDIYCVFSGGDDLFLIGPWNVICDLAVKINRDFHHYTGGNSNLTLSAAISLFQPKTHISYMAEQSEKALKTVKDGSSAIYPGRPGRNGISCLNVSFTWDDFQKEWERAKDISAWWLASPANRRDFPVSRMQAIQIYSKMYQEFLVDHDILGLMGSPYLEYDINRNYKRGCRANGQLWKYVTSLNKNTANYNKPKPELYFADFCMYAVRKLTREVRNDGIS